MTVEVQEVERVVLLVDDMPSSLDFLVQALDQAGYTVLVAPGGVWPRMRATRGLHGCRVKRWISAVTAWCCSTDWDGSPGSRHRPPPGLLRCSVRRMRRQIGCAG